MGVGDPSVHSRTSETAARDAGEGTLLWALQRIAQLANQTAEGTAALDESLRLLCQAGGFSAGHALLAASGGRLISAGGVGGGDRARRCGARGGRARGRGWLGDRGGPAGSCCLFAKRPARWSGGGWSERPRALRWGRGRKSSARSAIRFPWAAS